MTTGSQSDQRRKSRNAVISYRVRLVGYTLWFVMLMSIPAFQHDPPRWVLAGFLLLLPHLFYFRSRHARSGYLAEGQNMLLEYFIGGILLASFEVRLWPTTITFLIGILGTINFGGPRLVIKGLLLQPLGIAIGFAMFGFNIHLETEPIPVVISIVSGIAFVLAMGTSSYRLRTNYREAKQIIAQERQVIAEEKDKSQRLLLKVFPEAVIPRLNSGENPIADEFADVTVLFSDIVGYTSLAERLGPRRTVMLLNDLYRRFDQAAAECGVEKVETVGDGYLAVAGAPTRNDHHPEAAARFALALIEAAKQVPVAASEAVQIRVGIHTGPIFAGVIGEHRFHYAIFGETVNVAARVQGQSQPGRILVSESAYKRLQDGFQLDACGSFELKGHGPMRTFWLTGSKQGPA